MKHRPRKKKSTPIKVKQIDNSVEAKLSRDIAHVGKLIDISECQEIQAEEVGNEILAKLFCSQVTKLTVQLRELESKVGKL